MAAVTPGVIVIWSGAIIDIPTGWVLCDGNNGTPDLVERFVVGAGGAYSPNDSGGDSTHNHTFTTDGHTHTIGAGTDINTGIGQANVTDSAVDTGTTNNRNHLPPYYALAYMMKT